MKLCAALVLVAAFGLMAARVLQVSQGLYEDNQYVSGVTPGAPLVVSPRPRALAWASLHYQITHALTPRAIRVWNLGLACLVSLAVGVFAWRLGLPGWFAGGLMLVHPLTLETLATMSGRFELVAALGVVLACLAATWRSPWALVPITAALAIGVLGKESAITGLVLVPLTWCAVRGPSARRHALVALGLACVVFVCWQYRHIGYSAGSAADAGAWALWQAGAGFRLLWLSIVPIGQTLDYDYDALSSVWLWLAAVNLAIFTYAAVCLCGRRPVLALALSWPLVVIVPRLIVQTPRSYFNEHQWYLALVGVALTGAAAVKAPAV